jgi:hypothetical protein
MQLLVRVNRTDMSHILQKWISTNNVYMPYLLTHLVETTHESPQVLLGHAIHNMFGFI